MNPSRRASSLAACGILALIVAATALAAPPRPIRSAPARAMLPGLAPAAARTGPATGLDAACGTDVEALPDVLAEHAARFDVTVLPTPNSIDAGEIAVLEDDGTFFYNNSGGKPVMDIAAVGRAFYRTHGDDYDCLTVYLSTGMTQWLGSASALAAAWVMRNATQGLGLDPFDYGPEFGSPARLQWLLTMNGLQRYPADPDENIGGDTFSAMDVLAHEFGHRWLAYTFVDSAGTPTPALLGRANQHWNFFADVDSSYMEGCDWARIGADSFRTDGVSSAFGTLDLYLMGLQSKADTDSFFVVNEPVAFDPPGNYIPITSPFVGLGCRGRATWWKVDDIERVHGARVPSSASAPHQFRCAFVLVTPHGSAATAADLAELDTLRTRFPNVFANSTRTLGSLDVSIDSRAGHVEIVHAKLPDTENAVAPRPIGARVTIAGGSLPLAVNPGSVTAWWRAGTSGAFTSIAMSSAGPDSFAAMLPALPGGGVVQYYLYASSDSAGIDATAPPAGAAAPYSYVVGPDATPPAVVHVRVPRQSRTLMPYPLLARVTDNLGVDSVWCEFRTNGGALQSAACVAAGRDSYHVALGAGLNLGGTLTYRFVARDRSAAHLVAYSNVAFDTLKVGADWYEDVENGATWAHQNVLFSQRDAWHPTQESASPAGGTAWKCGADAGMSYLPHLDAALSTSLIYDITPGTLLQFDHHWGLEQLDATNAYDGARVEARPTASSVWQILTPAGGYSHTFIGNGNPLGSGTACWSGAHPAWRTETFDLSAFAGTPVQIRFRMGADDFVGDDGWTIDKVRIFFPGGGALDAPHGPTARVDLALALAPNPARDRLHVELSLPAGGPARLAFYDLAGRRVHEQTLAQALAPGVHVLDVELPAHLRTGVYFAQVLTADRASAARRFLLVR